MVDGGEGLSLVGTRTDAGVAEATALKEELGRARGKEVET